MDSVGPYKEPSAQPGGILVAPQKVAQELRDSSHFKLVESSPYNQGGTIPNNLPYHTLEFLSLYLIGLPPQAHGPTSMVHRH
jgi:hypothetical protein